MSGAAHPGARAGREGAAEAGAIWVHRDAGAAAQAVAAEVVALLRHKPDAVLGLATGGTMEPVYAGLLAARRDGRVSFARATTFNLDEYVGLPPEHAQSYRSTMDRMFFGHVDIDRTRTFVPDGMARDRDGAAAAFERLLLEHGPVDVQLLGVGRNGHIGFNEPGSPPDSRTRDVELHGSTLSANERFFRPQAVPRSAITMGIATILDARRILVLAVGEEKRAAVKAAFAAGPRLDCPASWLRGHRDVRWHCDENAADEPQSHAVGSRRYH